MVRILLLIFVLSIVRLVARNPVFESPPPTGSAALTQGSAEEAISQPSGMGMRMGPGSGMRERHQAPIPAEYAGLSNPVEADEASLSRGAELYPEYCVNCHNV